MSYQQNILLFPCLLLPVHGPPPLSPRSEQYYQSIDYQFTAFTDTAIEIDATETWLISVIVTDGVAQGQAIYVTGTYGVLSIFAFLCHSLPL